MKKQILAAIAVSLFIVSCTKSTSKTETTENPDGSVTTTTVTETTSGIIDTSKIDKARNDIKSGVDAAGNKIENTAEKVNQDLKKAGEDVKDAAAKGAQKVEEGARNLKEDLNK